MLFYNCKFPCAQHYIDLKLKFRKNKNCHQKSAAHWYIVTSMLLKSLQLHLVDVPSFRSDFATCINLDAFHSNALIILVLFLQIVWIVELMRPSSWYMLALFFHFLFDVSLLLFLWHSKPVFYFWLYPCYYVTSLLLTGGIETWSAEIEI